LFRVHGEEIKQHDQVYGPSAYAKETRHYSQAKPYEDGSCLALYMPGLYAALAERVDQRPQRDYAEENRLDRADLVGIGKELLYLLEQILAGHAAHGRPK